MKIECIIWNPDPLELKSTSIDPTCHTSQKLKFSIKNFFSKHDQIRRKLQIWSHLLNKSLMENFIFCSESQCSFKLHSYSERGWGWNPMDSLLGDFRVMKFFISVNQLKEIWKPYNHSSWRHQIFDDVIKRAKLRI